MKNSKRRGAVKVPNVILRPAQASTSRSVQREASLPRVDVDVDGDGNDDEFDLTSGNKPFSGVVICATGELDKRTLFTKAQELGAMKTSDFTDQVTHLVADAPGSAKYRCAIERNLPVMKETWVQEAYNAWLNGGVVDLEQSMADHRLPIFTGVKLCLTGLDNVSMQTKMQALFIQEGGTYMKSLDASVTHLLCCASNSSDKIQWSKEFNIKYKSKKIQMVWEEWFWDCLEFRGRWDEATYDITNPRPVRKSVPQTLLALKNDTRLLPTSSFSQPPLPKSIPTAALLTDDAPEYGQIQKKRGVGLRILESIVQKRNCQEIETSTQRQGSKGDINLDRPAPTNPILDSRRSMASFKLAEKQTDVDSGSVLRRLANHRVASFAPVTCGESGSRQPFRRVMSTSSNAALIPQASFLSSASSSTISSQSRMLFTGYTFCAFGEANSPILRAAVEQHGGLWLEDNDDETANFLLVRLASGGLFWREELDEGERRKFRTECWIERCIFEERICAGDEHITFTPLKIVTPVKGSDNLYVSLSGLDSAETCWTKRLLRAIGANFPSAFSRRSTHLVCPSGCGAKYEKAIEWNVRVVNLDWLFAIANTGSIPDAGDFENVQDTDKPVIDNNIDQAMNVKGKGKANIVEGKDGKMTDITNDRSQECIAAGIKMSLLVRQSTKDMKPRPFTAGASPSSESPIYKSSFHINQSDINAASTFGKPTALLSDHPPRIQQTMTDSESVPSHASRTPTRASTVGIEQDKQITRIPSSHSPSPLKIPSKPPSVTSPPMGETRGLRTAITALLGKRGTEAREDDASTQRHPNRNSKRPRHLPRVNTDLDSGHVISPSLSLIAASSPLSYVPPHREGEASMEERESCLRVVYEDPDQRAEKNKLIALFEKGPHSNEDLLIKGGGGGEKESGHRIGGHQETASKKKLVRRATRITGR